MIKFMGIAAHVHLHVKRDKAAVATMMNVLELLNVANHVARTGVCTQMRLCSVSVVGSQAPVTHL